MSSARRRERPAERVAQVLERRLHLVRAAPARLLAEPVLGAEHERDAEQPLHDALVDLAREVDAGLQQARAALLAGRDADARGQRGGLAERPHRVALRLGQLEAAPAAVGEDHAQPAPAGRDRRAGQRLDAREVPRSAPGTQRRQVAAHLDHAVLGEGDLGDRRLLERAVDVAQAGRRRGRGCRPARPACAPRRRAAGRRAACWPRCRARRRAGRRTPGPPMPVGCLSSSASSSTITSSASVRAGTAMGVLYPLAVLGAPGAAPARRSARPRARIHRRGSGRSPRPSKSSISKDQSTSPDRQARQASAAATRLGSSFPRKLASSSVSSMSQRVPDLGHGLNRSSRETPHPGGDSRVDRAGRPPRRGGRRAACRPAASGRGSSSSSGSSTKRRLVTSACGSVSRSERSSRSPSSSTSTSIGRGPWRTPPGVAAQLAARPACTRRAAASGSSSVRIRRQALRKSAWSVTSPWGAVSYTEEEPVTSMPWRPSAARAARRLASRSPSFEPRPR